uniref:Uncharacterized protein n=1 Tax=Salix viminalis TaxID=40686 RepID=A0A6N2NJ74_SALVM
MAIFSPSPTYPKPLPIPTQSSSPLPFSIHSLRLSLPPSPLSTGPTPRLSRCHAALSPQPPPQSDPPPGKDPQGSCSDLLSCSFLDVSVLLGFCMGWKE